MPSDPNGIMQSVYDPTNRQLSTTAITAASTQSAVAYDLATIVARCYDPATKTLRVIAV